MEAIENEISIQSWVDEIINDLETDYFGVSAGLGSGKTHGAMQWLYDRCVLNSESPYSVVMMPTYQKIHDSAIPKLRQVLADIGLVESIHYSVLKSPFPKLLFKATGHEVHFISAANPETIVGVEYSHGVVSEAGTTNNEALQRIVERVRFPKAVACQLLFEGVPECGGLFQSMFDDQEDDRWIERKERCFAKVVETEFGDVNYKRYRVRTYDNPFITTQYIAGLHAQYADNPNYKKAYLEGIFAPIHVGNVYDAYRPHIHDIEELDAEPYKPLYLTWDFNANPVTWIALQEKTFHEGIKKVNRYIALDECSIDVEQLDKAVSVFAAKFPVHKFRRTPIEIYGDMSGHAHSHKVPSTDYEMIVKYLTKLGYEQFCVNALRYNPPETASVEAANSMFRADKCYVTKKCKKLKFSFTKSRWKEGVKKIDKPSGETWTHSGDAFKYFAYAINENYNDVIGTIL